MDNNKMRNKELIAALQKLNPEAIVTIDVRQHNKRYGRQLSIQKSNASYEMWVNPTYSGCTITVHLPEKAIISHWPKED